MTAARYTMVPMGVDRGTRRLLAIPGLCVLLAALPAPAPAAGPGIGGHAPEIEAADLAGAPRKLAWGDGAAAATIVYFFDPQSSECLLEMSFLDALHLAARDFGLAVYAVEARGRQPAEVARSMERYCSVYREPSFAVLPDPAFRIGRTYGAERIPVTFVAESHGIVLNRIEGYDHGTAVAIARRVEQLLRRERGFFTPVLREVGVSEDEERAAEARIAAAAARTTAPVARALGVGDRVPQLDFTDPAGRTGRWSWGDGSAAGLRVVAFVEGLSLESVEELNWLDALARRGRDAGLEVLAVEAGGMDAAALAAALERYRRYNPEPIFPVVADEGGKLAGIFGPLEQLPQTWLVAADGAVVYRAEGFGAGEGEIMGGKVERSFALAGRPLAPARPAADPADSAGAPPPAIDEEAPSIRKQREQDERFRSSIVQADAFFMSWEFERALPHYLAALEVEPKDLHALVRAAQIYERRGDPVRALELWERVLAVRPDHVEGRNRFRELRPNR